MLQLFKLHNLMTSSSGRAHLVRFTLAHAGAHSIHPQVGVQVIRAQTCVRVHDFGHRHGHRSHTAAVHIKQCSVTMSQKKPDPSGKQHPPHLRRVTNGDEKKRSPEGNRSDETELSLVSGCTELPNFQALDSDARLKSTSSVPTRTVVQVSRSASASATDELQ